jgi:transcriptional regulator with XRE-family HTH domain
MTPAQKVAGRAAREAGRAVKRLRKQRGWSLRTLAKHADLDFSHVWKIENGRPASLEAYAAVAVAFEAALLIEFESRRARRAH